MGWDELQNGQLLRAAEASGFHRKVTADKNLRHQHNLASCRIAIVELSTNNWPLMKPHIAQIVHAVNHAITGSYTIVSCGVFARRRRQLPEPDF